MAKRYYVCKVIGDGQTPETAFRPAIADVLDPTTGMQAFSVAVVLATHPVGHPQAGQPVLPWCLVVASGANHALADGNPDIDPLPDYPMDARVSAMHTPTRNQMAARLQGRGINMAFLSTADGYREVVRHLGQRHQPTFSENNFDVSE